jgi:histidine ammonia-lyase
VATELVCAAQGLEFHRPLTTTGELEGVVARVREYVPRVEEDRSLAGELAALARALRTGELPL